jgi:hypothetical protein
MPDNLPPPPPRATLKPVSPIAALESAMGHLDIVVRYGLGEINDRLDREHIVAAHELVAQLWNDARDAAIDRRLTDGDA